jgi:hypothetical protein
LSHPVKEHALTEAHHGEVEKVLLYISEARERAERARAVITREGGEEHLIRELERSEEVLRREHRRLLQTTFYAVPDQERLAV